MNDFKRLKVWQEAVELAVEVYKQTRKFPREERYGLISQINRCAVSIASNIAEGAGRGSSKDFVRFVHISTGSAYELETQLIIAQRVEMLAPEIYQILIDRLRNIQKMLAGLRKSLTINQ